MTMDDLDSQTMNEIRAEFFNDAAEQLAKCEESYLNLEKPELREEELNKIFRLAHSMKSGGAMLGITDLSEFAHILEDLLSIYRNCPGLLTGASISLLLRAGDAIRTKVEILRSNSSTPWDSAGLTQEIRTLSASLTGEEKQAEHRTDHSSCVGCTTECTTDNQVSSKTQNSPPREPQPAAQQTVELPTEPAKTKHTHSREPLRIDPNRVDAVLDLVGELVVLKGQLLEIRGRSEDVRENEVLSLIDKTARELQERALSMRLTSIRPLIVKIRRGVRDLSLALKKPIDLHVTGEDLELDRMMIDNLGDPLLHLIRNAVDHGLENADERKLVGKPETGKIILSVRQAGDKIIIEIRDDGRGINKEKVIKRAIERGIISAANTNLSDQEAYDLLFQPGFSTAEKVTDLSGRGVGLDVVKSNITKIRGTVNIESSLGIGSCFQLILPLTAAIVDGILVTLENQRMVVPMLNVVEIVRVKLSNVRELPDHSRVVTIRGSTFPLLDVSRTFPGFEGSFANFNDQSHEQLMLILECSQKRVALIVDTVLGQSQVVVKSMGAYFGDRAGLAGASIMGDGRVGLVLDVESLLKQNYDVARGTKSQAKAA